MIQFAHSTRPTPPRSRRTNAWVAGRLDDVAALLEAQGANRFRIQAYRRGAEAVRRQPRSVRSILSQEGRPGLEEIPGIGPSLSRAMAELVVTGRLRLLDRLRGALDPETLLATLPGVGPRLARRIHDELEVESLEALETAAWDGRLGRIPGIGARRLESLRAVLAQRLGRRKGPDEGLPRLPDRAPSVLQLLSVDREYRQKAAEGRLHRITPRRFNPEQLAWLPILHTERGAWHFEALFSNTERAHRLGKTDDWVVLYYSHDGAEGQATVVTETQPPLAGQRVVRGREEECATLYAQAAALVES